MVSSQLGQGAMLYEKQSKFRVFRGRQEPGVQKKCTKERKKGLHFCLPPASS